MIDLSKTLSTLRVAFRALLNRSVLAGVRDRTQFSGFSPFRERIWEMLRRISRKRVPLALYHRLALSVAVGTACASAFPQNSEAGVSSGDPASKMQLIAASSAPEEAFFRAGAEIILPPNAITYWRAPGEAGVPPQFSFSGSENIASPEVLFPAPVRIDEAGSEAFGYRGSVIFPIHVRPLDKSKPAILHLTMDYAVCERICIPVKSQADLKLPVDNETAANAKITTAEASVPRRLAPAEAAARIAVRRESGYAKHKWSFVWKGSLELVDLFVEGPTAWYFDTSKTGPNHFSIVEAEGPRADQNQKIPILVTATGPDKSFEFVVELDPAH